MKPRYWRWTKNKWQNSVSWCYAGAALAPNGSGSLAAQTEVNKVRTVRPRSGWGSLYLYTTYAVLSDSPWAKFGSQLFVACTSQGKGNSCVFLAAQTGVRPSTGRDESRLTALRTQSTAHPPPVTAAHRLLPERHHASHPFRFSGRPAMPSSISTTIRLSELPAQPFAPFTLLRDMGAVSFAPQPP